MKTVTPLQRGMACLCCRKRKMKCDGLRPVCTQCLKANRGTECQYHEKKHVSRTQLLQQKVAKLEARLRELESEQAGPSTSGLRSPSSPPPQNDTVDLSDPLSGAVASSLDWNQDFSTINLTQSIPAAPPTDSLFSDDLTWGGNTIQVNDELTIAGWSASKTASGSKWWEDRSSFCKNKQQLLEIFFSHRHQCAFDCHLARFRASLHLTPTHQPHPALMDAIYLMACYFSRLPPLGELEPHFLKRALAGISEALHQQDRMVQVLQASSLIAVYFFCQGRVLEGYYHSSTSARLAIDVGLHQIRPTTEWSGIQSGLGGGSAFPTDATFPLPPVKDPIEHAERVAAFWQIFIVDRAWSVATGLPSALPDDDHPRTQIATSWPMGIADMSTSPEACMNLPALVGSSMLGGSGGGSSSSNVTLRAKAVMLFERTARFASSSRSESDWASQRSLEMSLAQFSANLPGISRHANQFAPTRADVDLVTIHALIYAATIHLNRDHIETQTVSFEKCLYAASSVAALVRELGEDDYAFLDPINSTCWRTVADVYARMLSGAQVEALQYDAAAITNEMNNLLVAMRRLALFFPVAALP
ncbi:hypothetical protein DAEQUDRAFT_682747 [Daedalea quercina L-15889]|uniref:Zn(2)-C6 fungal-type domain-containing protein n=1 Tax=Daedalea quercina L-15889 TaxID=1314783 RepID=A0A165TVL2_9APHY|nr:hypothetical protein DAEQUDRAFT_682747 [Daedalea quercina L-15889]